MLPLQPTQIDGSEYLVTAIESAAPPGYVRVSAAETYWVLRDWAQHDSPSRVVELLRSLGAWRSAELPHDLRACVEALAERFDDSTPELALYRRIRAVMLAFAGAKEAAERARREAATPVLERAS